MLTVQECNNYFISWQFIPAIMSSTVLIFSSTCSIKPTSVLVCKLRTLLRRIAVNILQISAWHVTSQCSKSSDMHVMLSASWIIKFISRSNSPPTSYKRKQEQHYCVKHNLVSFIPSLWPPLNIFCLMREVILIDKLTAMICKTEN